MIIKLFGNVYFKLNVPFTIKRSEKTEKEIEKNWVEFLKQNKSNNIFNGNVFLVTNIVKNNEDYCFEVGKTKYSDLVYIKKSNYLKARSLFVASYIYTKDDYVCIIKDKNGRINTIGGLADDADFDHNNFFPQKCIEREFMEELGLDLSKKQLFYEYKIEYIKIPNEKEKKISLYPVGLLYRINTTLTKEEIIEEFISNKNFTDGEVSEIAFFNKNTYSSINQCKNIVSYIPELLHKIFN